MGGEGRGYPLEERVGHPSGKKEGHYSGNPNGKEEGYYSGNPRKEKEGYYSGKEGYYQVGHDVTQPDNQFNVESR